MASDAVSSHGANRDGFPWSDFKDLGQPLYMRSQTWLAGLCDGADKLPDPTLSLQLNGALLIYQFGSELIKER